MKFTVTLDQSDWDMIVALFEQEIKVFQQNPQENADNIADLTTLIKKIKDGFHVFEEYQYEELVTVVKRASYLWQSDPVNNDEFILRSITIVKKLEKLAPPDYF